MSDLISRERLINEWDDLGRRYAMPTTPIHKRAFREFPSADAISIDQANAMIKSYVSHYEENIPIKFNPVNVDCRGYTDTFRCSKCGCDITTSYVMQELDYDFCPWCGGKADE